jgi:hypothetical protein
MDKYIFKNSYFYYINITVLSGQIDLDICKKFTHSLSLVAKWCTQDWEDSFGCKLQCTSAEFWVNYPQQGSSEVIQGGAKLLPTLGLGYPTTWPAAGLSANFPSLLFSVKTCKSGVWDNCLPPCWSNWIVRAGPPTPPIWVSEGESPF